MRILALGCVLAGCARLGFDSGRTGPAVSPDGASSDVSDGAMPSFTCSLNAVVPDPITFSGETFKYTSTANSTAPVSNVVVAATVGGTLVDQQQSAMSTGAYMVSIPTGGSPVLPAIDYEPPGDWISSLRLDQPIDGNVAGPNMDYWRLGDAPLWGDGEMGVVYGSIASSYDLAKGTINIAVRDCAGNPVPGVVIDVSPTPDVFRYTDANGSPTGTQATLLPYATGVAFNAVPGPTHITATKDGIKVYSIDVDVAPGRHVTLPLIHVP